MILRHLIFLKLLVYVKKNNSNFCSVYVSLNHERFVSNMNCKLKFKMNLQEASHSRFFYISLSDFLQLQ